MKLANKGQEVQGEGVTHKRPNTVVNSYKTRVPARHLSCGPHPSEFKLGMLRWGGGSRG